MNDRYLKEDEVDAWTAALRSGEYTKVNQVYYAGEREVCALGCLAAVVPFGDDVVNGMPFRLWREVTERNDVEDKSFNEIADWIDGNRGLFTGLTPPSEEGE